MATRWGICGAGRIAGDFAMVMATLPSEKHQIVCIASRSDLRMAEEFAKKHRIPKAYATYEDVAEDPDIDVVYVANYDAAHCDTTKLMLNHGKNVLCEINLAPTRREAEEIFALAKEKNVFVMEAALSLYTPAAVQLRKELAAKTIGEPTLAVADFGMDLSVVPLGTFGPYSESIVALCGAFPVGFVLQAFDHEEPVQILATGHKDEYGTNCDGAILLKFSKGRTGIIHVHRNLNTENKAIIYGTKGTLEIPDNMWAPETLITPQTTYNFQPDRILKTNYPAMIGMKHEMNIVRECLLKGEKLSPSVPPERTLHVLSVLDEIKSQLDQD